MKKQTNKQKLEIDHSGKRIISYLLVVVTIILLFLVFPKPRVVESIEKEEVTVNGNYVDDTKERTIKEEIKYVFGDNWNVAYAVMMSEGGGDPKAFNQNSDSRRTHDRGLFQLNSFWHKEVLDGCAYDIKCNIKEAYRISKGGTDWGEWYGYTKGGYKEFL